MGGNTIPRQQVEARCGEEVLLELQRLSEASVKLASQ